MFYFNLKEAAIYQAIIWEKTQFFNLARIFEKVSKFSFVIFLLIFVFGFFTDYLSIDRLSFILGLAVIFFKLFYLFLATKSFL